MRGPDRRGNDERKLGESQMKLACETRILLCARTEYCIDTSAVYSIMMYAMLQLSPTAAGLEQDDGVRSGSRRSVQTLLAAVF